MRAYLARPPDAEAPLLHVCREVPERVRSALRGPPLRRPGWVRIAMARV